MKRWIYFCYAVGLILTLSTTACGSITSTTPANSESATAQARVLDETREVALGLQPTDTCEPQVDQTLVDKLPSRSTSSDPEVAARMKALYDADQAQRENPVTGSAMQGSNQTPGERATPNLPPPGLAQQTQPIVPQGQPTPSATTNTNTTSLNQDDKQRRMEVLKYLQAGLLTSADDLAYAAIIFHHGNCLDHFALAHLLAAKALELGSEQARSIYALSLERFRMAAGKPLKFGGYRATKGQPGKCEVDPGDPTVTDDMRKAYGLPTIAEMEASAESGKVICNTPRGSANAKRA